MDVFLETPPPIRNVTHFFRLCEASEALLILQALRLSVVYKRIIKSTLGARPGPDSEHKNILKIQIHL